MAAGNMALFGRYGLASVLLIVVLSTAGGSESVIAEDTLRPLCKLEDYHSFSDFLACVGHRRSKRYANNHNNNHNRYLHREEYGHPCHQFVELNQPERRVTNRVAQQAQNTMLCDRTLRRRWYKFSGAAGGVMPEVCVEEFSCGTHSPIWLNGQHPMRHGEVVDREVCASLSGKCCSRRWFIRVANCGDFYSYLLTDTPGCYMAYCAGNEMPCPPGQSSPTGFFPGCSANFPSLPGKAILRLGNDESEVKFYCDYEGTIERETVIDVDWFVEGEKPGRNRYGEVPVWTDEMIERRRSTLTEGYWEGKLGSSIYCKMRARWRDEEGVQSPPVVSEKYFAGIKIVRRVVNVSESGPEGMIQLRSTVPVTCLPQFKDSCKVSVELAHDSNWQEKQCVSGKMQQVVFGDCHVDITPSNWNQTLNVSVKAVRDFYSDGNRAMRVGFKPIFTTFASDFWNDYKLPDVEVVAMDAPAQMCSSTGDPHYTTFDGIYYHVYLEGEFVLYKNTKHPLQINTRLEQCGKVVSCNCGVAVMADDDVIVIDRCRREKKNIASGKSFPDGWNTIHRHALEQGDSFIDGLKLYEYDDGRRYTIQLPTGAYIDFHVGENWINLFVHGSSDDWKSTLGLCGTFDGNPNNDFLFPDERTRTTPRSHDSCGNSSDVCKFAESWRVPDSQSLFKEVVDARAVSDRRRPFINNRYCKCEDKSGKSTIICNYQYDHQNCEQEEEINNALDLTNNVRFRAQRRMKRSAESYTDEGLDDYFGSNFVYNPTFKGQEPRWPTPSGITEQYAKERCQHTLIKSEIGRACYRHVYNDINKVIDACMVDIKVTDSFAWLQSSLDTMVSKCVNKIHDDASLWQTSPPPPTQATGNLTTVAVTLPSTEREPTSTAETILSNICPAGCSHKGHCIKRTCQCIAGYTGADCSIKLSSPPQITFLSDGALCDVDIRPCHKISVYGKNFRHSSPIHCQFKEVSSLTILHTTTAEFKNFEEVVCPLPEHRVGSQHGTHAHKAYRLAVQQDGLNSDEHPLIISSSKCQQCEISNGEYSCHQKDGTCSVGGQCYLNGEKNPNDCCEVCDTAMSTNSFVPAKDLQVPVLTPDTTDYRVPVGQFWQLTISATGSCDVNYEIINYTDKRGLQYAISESGVHFTAASSSERNYIYEVRAKDRCGAPTASRNYSVVFVPKSTTTVNPMCLDAQSCGNSAGEQHRNQHALPCLLICLYLMLVEDANGRWINLLMSVGSFVIVTFRSCLSSDTRSPTVDSPVLNLTAIKGEMMTFQVEAGHPVQGQTLKYYVLKNSDSYISISQSGVLKYMAPTHDKQESLTVIVEDTCEEKIFVDVHIHTTSCQCQNNGTCIFEPQQQTGGGLEPMKCRCLPGYRGNLCEQSV